MSVISMFDRKKNEDDKTEVAPKQTEAYDFAQQMEANRLKAQREKDDKAKANKGVIRSYRLKN